MAYVHQEYPKCLYHQCLPPRTVANRAEHEALGPEWAETPAAFTHSEEAAPPRPAPPAAVSPEVPTGPGPDAGAIAGVEQEPDGAEQEAAALHAAPAAAIIARLAGSSEAVLRRVRAFEEQNPTRPGGRKGVLAAVDKALKALAATDAGVE